VGLHALHRRQDLHRPAVPAPSAEPPPAAEQTPETEPPTGWQWLNTSKVGLFAGTFIDSVSSWQFTSSNL
jgi:hypothetical protein